MHPALDVLNRFMMWNNESILKILEAIISMMNISIIYHMRKLGAKILLSLLILVLMCACVCVCVCV